MYKYSDEEIKRISGVQLTRGEPTNKGNGKHLPELIKHAEKDLAKAEKSGKATAIEAAREILEERKEKLRVYKKAFGTVGAAFPQF